MKVSIFSEEKWKVEFTYSPLFEILCSLHVLVNPQHHLDRLSWAEQMKDRLPEKLYTELLELGQVTGEWCAVMDFCNDYERCDDFSVMAALDFIDELPLEKVALIFQRNIGVPDITKGVKSRITNSIREYYLFYFEKELRFIEPLLVRTLKRDAESCNTKGVLNYLNDLHGRIEITNEAFLFHKFTLFTVPFDKIKRIIVRISSFITPHLLMGYDDEMVQFTATAHLDKKIEKVPLDLLKVMKALSDETRLKIVRKIFKQKSTTQKLALELGLTEACISKHLKILYDAELLYKERDGNFIYYYMNCYYIDRISQGIYEYIDN